MRQTRSRPARAGFTLIEMMISITLLLMIFAIAVPFFRAQAGAVDRYAGRLDAQLNARFGINTVDRELRAAGVGIVDAQPMIVQADKMAITFNGDLVTHDSTAVGAVYFDPDVDSTVTAEMIRSNPITLPLSTKSYPDSTYVQSGSLTPSLAETISYYLVRDSSAGARSDQYNLYRRVNATTPRLIAKGVIIPSGQPAFRYFKNDTLGASIEISQALLPLYHTAVHGSPADTQKSALTDSIRVVRAKFAGIFHDARRGDIIDTVESGVRIMNSGLVKRTTCGDPPILGVSVTATVSGSTPRTVTLTWNRATDEAGGEKDVEKYAIYRRMASDPSFDEPVLSRPAGSTSYTYVDNTVVSGQQYIYGIAAIDCTPLSSSVAATSTVTIP
jgi:prepilin-type N-terminal cleavage/methylation domain-containing protein